MMGLEYDPSFHLEGPISLESGRKVLLESIKQWITDSDWIEGVPSREWNDTIVEASRLKVSR